MAINQYRFGDKNAAELLQRSAKLAVKEGYTLFKQINDELIKLPEPSEQGIHQFALKNLEQYLKRLHEKAKIRPSCRAECSACCTHPVWTTHAELDIIQAYIRDSLSAELQERLTANLREWHLQIGQEASNLRVGDQDGQYRYIAKQVLCPLLLNDNCCIYPVRPVACRVYYSYGNPKDCAAPGPVPAAASFDCAIRNVYLLSSANVIRKYFRGTAREDYHFQRFSKSILLPLALTV